MTENTNAPPGAAQGALADIHDSPNGERVASQHAEPQKLSPDWAHEQQKLRSRWASLTDDDFTAAAGDRTRFVEKLAEREQISRESAEIDLAGFETRKSIAWRAEPAVTQADTPQISIGTSG